MHTYVFQFDISCTADNQWKSAHARAAHIVHCQKPRRGFTRVYIIIAQLKTKFHGLACMVTAHGAAQRMYGETMLGSGEVEAIGISLY